MAESVTSGLLSFADAVQAARTSIADAAAVQVADEPTQAVDESVPVADQAISSDVLEHPDVATDDASAELSIFADVEDELLVEPNPLTEGGPDFDIMAAEVQLDGFDSPVTVSELAKGYLRQADYTRKTQELAEQRKVFEQEQDAASRLLKALRDDPGGTVASLAIEVGLIKEGDLTQDVVARINSEHRVPSREEVERQIEERAKAMLESDPRIQEAEDRKVWAQIEEQFTNLEADEGVKFSERDKEAILKHAVENDIHRVDLAYLDLKRKADTIRAKRKAAAQAAPASAQQGRVQDSTSTQPTSPAESVREAWARAKASGISVS